MEDKKAEPVPEESEKKHMIDLCMDYEEPEDTNDYVQVIEGIKKCTLCGKHATEGHLLSTEHHKRREEQSNRRIRKKNRTHSNPFVTFHRSDLSAGN